MSVYSTSERRLIVVGPPYSRVPAADRAASVALLLLLLPMIALISVALWFSARGPVFTATPCLDGSGRRCRLWSFRTRRAVLLGRFLREHGLDRLPVLLSVADGTVTLREALALEPVH